MLAIKSSVDDDRYAAATRKLGPGRVVKCPHCLERFILYTKSPVLLNRAEQRLVDYLARYCPNHAECFVSNEAA